MKLVLVGDPHVQVNNLEESKKILSVAESLSKQHKAKIVLLGDLFHNHSVIRMEVLSFWSNWLQKANCLILVGNHDMAGSKELEGKVSALDAFKNLSNVQIVDAPVKAQGIFFVPYMHSSREFEAAVQEAVKNGAKSVICHQTVNGAVYENGFYAPGGIEPSALSGVQTFISGHIHSRQEFTSKEGTKFWYPGTARWLTASDANQKKYISVVDLDENGRLTILHEEDMETHIEPIRSFVWEEKGIELDLELIKNPEKTSVILTGSSDWVKKMKKKLPEGTKVSSKITDRLSQKMNKKNTNESIYSYIDSSYEPILVTKPELKGYLEAMES